ncbi:MAG: PA14 domain-containing protein, partial [Planctomycetaceae bacterium]
MRKRLQFPGPWGLVLIAAIVTPASAQDDDDDDFRPGLHAKYTAGKKTVERIDPDIAFDWGTAAPDQRLPAGAFTAEWTGKLLVKKSAAYTFHGYAAGDIALEIDGKPVLTGKRQSPGWLSGKTGPLRAGPRKLRLRFRSTGKTARIQLFWSAERFPLEPVPPRLLFRDKRSDALLRTETGRVSFDVHRCNRCHRRTNDPPSPPGPDLTHVVSGLSPTELTATIRDPQHNSPYSKMPTFGFTAIEAQAVAAFLRSVSKPVRLAALPRVKRRKPRKKSKYDVPKAPLSERRSGELLFRSVGCLACHSMGKNGHTGPYTGGDLSNVGAKRSARWLYQWLKDPKSLNGDHRMPVFRLTTIERKELAVFLASVRNNQASGGRQPTDSSKFQDADQRNQRADAP